MASTRTSRLKTLYAKEWMRLKRNPAALMAVGLIILMAFLVNIENKASKKAKKQDNQPCAIVYNTEDAFIQYLKAQPEAKKHRIVQIAPDLNADLTPDYPENIRCAVEVAPELKIDGERSRAIKFRMVGKDNPKIHATSRWVLGHFAQFESKVKLMQSMHSMKDKAPTKTLGNIDLGSSGAKAMVGAMLLYSVQYFLCCALFISFAAHERERGILQAMALTTASATEILLSKIVFHLSLSLVASVIIISILTPLQLWWFPFNLVMLIIILMPSLGFVAIATIITSLNRTQTTASLVGFCYLMLMGVIFALAPKFIAFAWIKAFMFEGHAIALFNSILSPNPLGADVQKMQFMSNLFDVILLPAILTVLATWLWKSKGWRNL